MAAFTLDGKDYDDYIDGIPGKYLKANDKYGCTGKRASCFRTAGNRLSKTVNESSTTYYVNDTSGSLTQVVAEIDQDGKETAGYTRGDCY